VKRRAPLPLIKVTINIYAEDKVKLQDLHGDLGYSRVIREIIHSYVRRTDEGTAQRVQSPAIMISDEVIHDIISSDDLEVSGD
jgi:hypothetical protein